MAGNGIDLATLLSQSSGQNANLSGAVQEIKDVYSQLIGVSQDHADAIEAEKQDQQVISVQHQTADLQAQQATALAAQKLGTDISDPSEVMTALADQMNVHFTQANQALDKIHSKESVSLYKDPIQHILNGFTLPQDYSDYNYEVDKYNLAAKQLTSLNQATREIALTQQTIKPSISAATISASQDLIAQQARQKADLAKAQGLQLNSEGITKVASMGEQQLTNSFQSYGVVKQDENFQIALDQRTEQVNAKKDQLADDENFANDIRVGFAATLGEAALQMPTKVAIKRFLNKSDIAAQHAYAIGAAAALRPDGHIVLGSSPAEAGYIWNVSGAQVPEQYKNVTNLIDSAARAAVEQARVSGVVPKKPEELFDLTNKNLAQFLAQKAKVIETNDMSNPYQAPKASDLAQMPGIRSKFFDRVLLPQIKSGMTYTDPERITQLALTGIKEGKVTLNEAVQGTALFFTAAAKLNSEISNFGGFNLPQQSSYNARIDVGRGRNDIVDMTSSQAVANAISKRLAAESPINNTSYKNK